jgi:hypothetical protein
MSFYHGCKTLTRRFHLVLASFLQSEGLPFGTVLPEEQIERAFEEEGVPLWSADDEEDAVYTPPVTLWAFLSQKLHKGEQRSCVAAVARVVVLLATLGREPPSGNTGAYCRARRLRNCTAVAGLRNWIFARSRSRWTWTCCDARRRKWCAAKYGRTCWPTT